MIVTLPFPIPIAQEAREYMSLECVFFFLLLIRCHVECEEFAGMILFWWHMCQLGLKLVIKWHFIWAVGTGILSLSECNTKVPLEEFIATVLRLESLKPAVESDSLRESSRSSAVRIGIFATEKGVIPKGPPSKHLRMHFDLFRRKHTDQSRIERLEMALAGCSCCLQYWSLFGADKHYGLAVSW